MADKLADLPSPFLIKGMDAGVARIVEAIQSGEKIVLYGDYDVDGVCSTSLMNLFLNDLGAVVSTYIPHRIREGYGLNLSAVEMLAKQGNTLMITLDCGITSVSEVGQANRLGMEVVIVDHHTVPSVLPPAKAILNPHQPGCQYPTPHLCAAGVAFNLCLGLRKALRDQGHFSKRPEPNLKSLLDLVAIATIADVVPLTGANRVFVKVGLEALTEGRRPGVRALKEVSGLLQGEEITAGQVGFRLGPRLNAAGRLDDASTGLKLLCCATVEDARPLAQLLESANAERQSIEKLILLEALKQAGERPHTRGLVLHSEGWHPGVVGIVASRVVEAFSKPTIVIAVKEGIGRGSGRSIASFHLFDALEQCSQHLEKFGGHKHAAGLTIQAKSLAAFTEAFERHAAEKVTDEDLVPSCKVDAFVVLSEITEELVNALHKLGPFGNGNPEPVLASRRINASGRVLAGKASGKGHLKLSLTAGPHLDAIGFGMADSLTLTEGPLDIAFQVSIDTWKGVRKISLKMKDLRISA